MAESSSSGGLGFFGVMQVVLLCAKIFEIEPVVGWSWWWVLSPMLAGAGIIGGMLLVLLLVFVWTEMDDRRRTRSWNCRG